MSHLPGAVPAPVPGSSPQALHAPPDAPRSPTMTTRTYPQGWDRSRFQGAPYAVRGSETDGTARVPFMSRLDAQGGADDAASRTGHPMEVIPEPGAGWSYRPVAEPTPAGVAP